MANSLDFQIRLRVAVCNVCQYACYCYTESYLNSTVFVRLSSTYSVPNGAIKPQI